jgi:hypothetical protein
MAELTTEQRQHISNGLMRYWSSLAEEITGMNKNDIKAAVDATDTWIDNNQSSYNTALPSAARTNLTQAQKTLLFCAVAAYRNSKNFAIRLFGEVD